MQPQHNQLFFSKQMERSESSPLYKNGPHEAVNPCPAEPGYTLPLQTV